MTEDNESQFEEFMYFFTERLGLMCEDRTPTPEQTALITYCNSRGKLDLANALRAHWDALRIQASIKAEGGKS